jgi:hypothetical protein
MNVIPAVTIWQPWATLIIGGWKPWEFRRIGNPISFCGKRIAIHAGMRKVRPAEISDLIMRMKKEPPWSTGLAPEALPHLERWHTSPGMLPLGAVIGTAIMERAIRADKALSQKGLAVGNDSDRDDHFNWAWPMLDPMPLEPIYPCSGKQGWWSWDADQA